MVDGVLARKEPFTIRKRRQILPQPLTPTDFGMNADQRSRQNAKSPFKK
jgi:hypothetical protein